MTLGPVLWGMPQPEVQRLISQGRRRRFGRGDTITCDGESSPGLHLLVHGRAAVRMITPRGDQLIMDVLGPGAAVGGLARSDHPRATSAVVTALRPCVTILLPPRLVEQLGGTSIESFLVRALARRVEALSARLMETVYLSAAQRVQRRLLELDAEFDGVIELTQDELALMSGTTRSTVNETLRGLERLGAVRIGRGRVVITDRQRLGGHEDFVAA